jgi:ubiquinol-cytochrome c reductase iron-sulfur subunit
MAPLTSSTSKMLRVCARQRLPSIQATSLATQKRGRADASASFDSPFKGIDDRTTKIPDFRPYMSKKPETSNRVFQYFMAGSMGALAGYAAKATVQGGFLPSPPNDSQSTQWNEFGRRCNSLTILC